MNTKDKISKAKARLLVNYPYFGLLASKISLVLNDNIKAFKSTSNKLEYSKNFLANASVAELEFVLANGAMHSSLSHENRKNARSGWLWQMATDMAINDMLVENGLEMPYEAQYREQFKGMYAEQIYEELKADMLRNNEDSEYDFEDIEDNEQNLERKQEPEKIQAPTEEEILQEQLFAESAISLLELESKRGDIPSSIDRFFKIDFNSKINWRDELKSAMLQDRKDDYSLMPPNKKFLSMGIYLPSSTSQTFKLVIVVDSSGSIETELLNKFFSEVDFLMGTFGNYEIDLIVCDDKIHSHKQLYKGDALSCTVKGGGGTDFRVAFEFIDRKIDNVNLLLYFTDLKGVFPKIQPNYQVKWICQKEEEYPFGTILIID